MSFFTRQNRATLASSRRGGAFAARPLAAAAGLLLLPGIVCLEAGTRLSLGERSGAPGQSLSTPIEVASDEGLVAFQLDLEFDAAAVAIGSVSAEPFESDHVLRSEEVVEGQRRLLVYSPSNAALDGGVVGRAQVDLLSGFPEGAKAFSLSNVRFVAETGATLEVSLAPFVRLVSPEAGSSFGELERVSLSGLAVETEGETRRVEFLVNGRVIAEDASAPYSASWLVDGLGNTLLSVVAFDSDGDASRSPEVPIAVAPAPFMEDWRAERFSEAQRGDASVSGLSADPDGDGVPNALEFAFGLDPLRYDDSGMPEARIETDEAGERRLSIRFEKPTTVSQLEYIVEVSEDLANWLGSEARVSETSLGVENGKELIEGRSLTPLSETANGELFIRVRVEPAD